MLITGGLNDPRVTYWEPAKWAAKLRDNKTDDNLLMLKINMGAGHGGKSGRWERAARGGGDLCLRTDAGANDRPDIRARVHCRCPSTSTSSVTSTMRSGSSGYRPSPSRIGMQSLIRRTTRPISGS